MSEHHEERPPKSPFKEGLLALAFFRNGNQITWISA